MLGRERERAAIRQILLDSDVSLLTLTGPAGVGKTRLAVQVAADLHGDFPDGVGFVPLVSVRAPRSVIAKVSRTLGVWEARGRNSLEGLKTYLRQKRALLLLDNFEQVPSAAPLVSELLAACPGLKALVTSRARLHLSGKNEFPLSPLPLPDPAQVHSIPVLQQIPSVALFVQRAQGVKPDFQLTQANAPAVAEICARLDGLPLAIELAAARVRHLAPQAMLAHLGRPLEFLTAGALDLPPRHQSLREAIAWSVELLDAREQRLFRHLSVFSGCTLEAMEAVCDPAGDLPMRVLDAATGLVDKNLLRWVEQGDGKARLIMLETFREYAMECLQISGEAEATRRAHAGYCLSWAEEAGSGLASPEQKTWLDRLDAEHENLRSALTWSLEQGKGVDTALRLSGALWRFWLIRGHVSEGRRWLEAAVARNAPDAGIPLAQALHAAGLFAHYQGDYDRAWAFADRSLAMSREAGDNRGVALALRGQALIARALGDYTSARAMLEESLSLAKGDGDRSGFAWSLSRLGQLTWLEADWAGARSLVAQSLALFRELGERQGLAGMLCLQARIAAHAADSATARAMCDEAMATARYLGDKRGIAQALACAVELALPQGDHSTARALGLESLDLFKALADRWSIAMALEQLAWVAASQRQLVLAARLCGAAEAHREDLGVPLPPVFRSEHERLLTGMCAGLGEPAFLAAWTDGRRMTAEQAIAPSRPAAKAEPMANGHAALTGREVEVLRLVTTGLTDAQVADSLTVSHRTVNAHLRSIYSKLGVPSRAAATRYAVEHRLV